MEYFLWIPCDLFCILLCSVFRSNRILFEPSYRLILRASWRWLAGKTMMTAQYHTSMSSVLPSAFRLPLRILVPVVFIMISYYHTNLLHVQIPHETRRCMIIHKIVTRKDVKTNHIKPQCSWRGSQTLTSEELKRFVLECHSF
jgi:hypothetical protein